MKLTITAYREKIVQLIEVAKAEVCKLEEQLQLFDKIVKMKDGGKPEVIDTAVKVASHTETKPITNSRHKGRDTSAGKLMRQCFLEVELDKTIDVPTVVKAAQQKFPNMSYESLSKRASSIARRLAKSGKIKIEVEGSGRTPHTYKRVSY